tara:strand:- start:2091 stop:3893 length:1803 start_codon:yes stop_codon:yes gene_type:complete
MITINYSTNIINVPKAYTLFISTDPQTGLEVRAMDIVQFGKDLYDVQDNIDGMWAPTAFEYTAPKNVGGVSLAPVLLILEPYRITFEDGQYAINLTGGNTNLQDFVTVNQVSIRPNNSVGLTFSKQVEDSAFQDGRVWVNTTYGQSGTSYPRGTIGDPVDNLIDAQAIIAVRRLPKRIHLTGNITTTSSDDITDYDIIGASSRLAFLDITTGTDTNNLVVSNISMTGDLNGNITASNASSFDSIIDFDGRMILCGLKGVIDLGSAGQSHDFIDCFSEEEGLSRPIVDCDNLGGNKVQFRRYSGGLTIRNFVNGGSEMSIDINQGTVEIESNCIGGDIVIRGIGTIIDNSGIGCNVNSVGFNTGASSVWTTVQRDAVITDTAAVAAKLPTDGNNIASDAQVASATGVWSTLEKNSIIADIAEILADTVQIVAKLPVDGNDISSDAQIVALASPWTPAEKNNAISQLTTIASKLPSDAALIAGEDDVLAAASPFTPANAVSMIAQLTAIASKLPVNGAELAGQDDVLAGASPWSSIQRDDVLSDLIAIVSKLPIDGFTIASNVQVSAVSNAWTEQEKDDLIANLDTAKRQALKAANNTEPPL